MIFMVNGTILSLPDSSSYLVTVPKVFHVTNFDECTPRILAIYKFLRSAFVALKNKK